jgi:hypothetical protein
VYGHDFFLWATMRFALSDAKDKIMVDLFVHRQDMKKEGFMTLEQLLYKYGRMQSTEPRDRVFSLYPLASECSGIDGRKYPIADYSISGPALFFA